LRSCLPRRGCFNGCRASGLRFPASVPLPSAALPAAFAPFATRSGTGVGCGPADVRLHLRRHGLLRFSNRGRLVRSSRHRRRGLGRTGRPHPAAALAARAAARVRPGAPAGPPLKFLERPLGMAICASFGLRIFRRVLPLAIHAPDPPVIHNTSLLYAISRL
jgi:hypothetical protein